MTTCECGHKVESKREVKKARIEFSNPGHVEFDVPAVECPECKELVYHEDDADKIFVAFDEAYKKKHLIK